MLLSDMPCTRSAMVSHFLPPVDGLVIPSSFTLCAAARGAKSLGAARRCACSALLSHLPLKGNHFIIRSEVTRETLAMRSGVKLLCRPESVASLSECAGYGFRNHWRSPSRGHPESAHLRFWDRILDHIIVSVNRRIIQIHDELLAGS